MSAEQPIPENLDHQRRRVEGIVLGAILAAAIALRLLRLRFLDSFEDGYQNWWIAGNLVLTGEYWDAFSGMTRGNWLPAYHFLAGGIIAFVGLDAMVALKAVNAVLSAGTALVVYLLVRGRGPVEALLAAALFATSPTDIVISSFAIPEPFTLFAVFSGYYMYLRRPFGARPSLALASAAFAFGAALRYEVWGFLALFVLFELAGRKSKLATVALVLLPSIAFAIGWWLWTSQWDFFPATIAAQTSTDPRYKESIGALAPAYILLGDFFLRYLGWNPFVVVAFAWAALRERRSFFTGLLLAFYFAEVVYTSLRFGNPGPRYIHLTVPVVCIFSSRAILEASSRTAKWMTRFRPAMTRRLPTGLVVASIVVASIFGVAISNPSRNPGFLLEGTLRAGEYLSTVAFPSDRLLLTESPIAAYHSRVPPSRIVGSAMLPDNATDAASFIRLNVAYVVYVTVPYYKLGVLFPDQANGRNNDFLQLVYDATGVEYDFGAPRVLVFRVLP